MENNIECFLGKFSETGSTIIVLPKEAAEKKDIQPKIFTIIECSPIETIEKMEKLCPQLSNFFTNLSNSCGSKSGAETSKKSSSGN